MTDRKVLHPLLCAVVIALVGLTAPRLAAAQTYSITDLGTLGGSNSTAYALNSSIQITGGANTASGNSHAFLFHSGLIDLGTLGGANSTGIGINASGEVAGQADLSFGATHAALWSNGGITDLGTLGGANSVAYGINVDELIVGQSDISGGGNHATLWDSGSITDLGTLGGANSTAYAINDNGLIVGQSDTAGGALHATLWSGINVTDLGTLGGTTSVAYGINTSGAIVGSSNLTGDVTRHAVLWQNGNMTDLGTLGGATSDARGINAYGLVVGQSMTGQGIPTAFLWKFGNLIDLNTLLPSGSGWKLLSAYAINDSGLIVGAGLINGQTHAFLMTPPLSILALTLSPNSLSGGNTSTGTVLLDLPAPMNGATVTLTSSNPAVAQAPANVVVPAGQTSATFNVTTVPVTSTMTAIIQGQYGGNTQGATMRVLPSTPQQLVLDPNVVFINSTSTGTLTLTGPAPTGGLIVGLSSSNTSVATVPAQITIPAGQTSGTFTVNSQNVPFNSSAIIRASVNGVSRGATLNVVTTTVRSVTLSPNTVLNGLSSTGTVTISGVAPPGGQTVMLTSSDNPVAQVPTSVTVPAGQSAATFTVTTQPVSAVTSVIIQAHIFGFTRGATLRVLPTTPAALTLNPNAVVGGASTIGTITLSNAAPSGGLTVTITSADSAVAQVPATIKIPAGAASATFNVTTSAVTQSTSVVIQVTANGVSRGATLLVKP